MTVSKRLWMRLENAAGENAQPAHVTWSETACV